ncbi:hypothetical protein S7711_02847 [Stachybotrys chartarum IBT 7711]|uniref:Amine oxidase n=1 Tax=Stachybotrys chartarum (strain CBS 109288 / IBT 7711) TaxID=1280523 RepID=A0A084AH67_STACB|nr:hypothetical protein S7711_02847 [Stachybotrys chartarum IBT 7711]KFA56209.1 hypothetical protein S40293_00111 [Stachybotrys chartarum IBT 40293]
MKLYSSNLLWLLGAEALTGAVAAPSPKVPWARQMQKAAAHSRRMLNAAITKRQATNETIESCDISPAQEIDAPKANVWGGLTQTEAVSIVEWLFGQPELNLTTTEEATAWDNTLLIVELMQPNKSDALAYIDGNSCAPTRYAHAILNFQNSSEPYYQDILVGPLPVRNGTTRWEPLDYFLTRKTEGKVRNLDADADTLYGEWHYSVGASIADITLDLWNATMMGLDNDTLIAWGTDPVLQDPETGRVQRWDSFFSVQDDIFDVGSILPMGLYFLTEIRGRNVEDWSLDGWYYDGQFFATTEEFREAYWAGDVRKYDGNWDNEAFHTDQSGPIPPMDGNAPPVSVAPHGARFAVDEERQYVEWMDWSFYIGFSRDTGLALYDIRLKGERIIYELGLQEAIAHYAGSDPVQSHIAYLDSFYGFGPFNFQLLPGFDCPSHAKFLNSSFYTSETTVTHINSICLFEAEADYLMMRHSSASYISATKNIYFSVRSVSTIGNYDYTFTYAFFMDGSMSVEVRASGYIQAAFYAHNEDYGFHIHDQLSGSMHDHVLNFKADIDVLGTANTIQMMDVVPHTTTYPWSNGRQVNTMRVNRTFIETEDEGKFNWSPSGQVFITNQEERNRFGELRSWRVAPGIGTSHLAVENSTAIGNAAHWATHDFYATVRKDTESRSAHPYNSQDVHDPPIDFSAFFDGESLNQTDIVLWLNLGMHHVPQTADLPNTVHLHAGSSIQFIPTNYFETGIQRETVNMIRINYDGTENGTEVETFGAHEDTCALQYEPQDVDLWGYRGDSVVRKFPFSPDEYYKTHPAD